MGFSSQPPPLPGMCDVNTLWTQEKAVPLARGYTGVNATNITAF